MEKYGYNLDITFCFVGLTVFAAGMIFLINIVGLVLGLPSGEFWSVPPPGGIKRARRAPKSTTGFTFCVFRVEWTRDKINSIKGYYETEAQPASLKQYECNLSA